MFFYYVYVFIFENNASLLRKLFVECKEKHGRCSESGFSFMFDWDD